MIVNAMSDTEPNTRKSSGLHMGKERGVIFPLIGL